MTSVLPANSSPCVSNTGTAVCSFSIWGKLRIQAKDSYMALAVKIRNLFRGSRKPPRDEIGLNLLLFIQNLE